MRAKADRGPTRDQYRTAGRKIAGDSIQARYRYRKAHQLPTVKQDDHTNVFEMPKSPSGPGAFVEVWVWVPEYDARREGK